MDIEQIRDYVLQKADVTEGFPFGEDTLVFKVKGKMFLCCGLNKMPIGINLKCNPDKAIELRETYPDAILPGYHMNKKHWNTVVVEAVKNDLLIEMIEDSFGLVCNKK